MAKLMDRVLSSQESAPTIVAPPGGERKPAKKARKAKTNGNKPTENVLTRGLSA